MPSPAVLRMLGYAYVAVSALLWLLTTIVSTAYAVKLKIAPLPRLRRGRRLARPRVADG